MITNPFILYGYESEKYFCDRKQETEKLQSLIVNGNNVALIAPRRIGKTGLIEHLFHQQEISQNYYTFLIDIYATKNMEELTLALSTSMLSALRPHGKKVMQQFVNFLVSLRTGVTFDAMGNPSWNLEIGNIKQQLYDMGATYAAMSGSGSALFGLFKEKPEQFAQAFSDMFHYSCTL